MTLLTLRPCHALVIACLLCGGAAHASVVSGAFTGTIAGNTYDTYGLFGPAGAALSGSTFTASYRYDTALASSYSQQANADAYLGTGNLTMQVTIGGATVATTGPLESEVVDTADGADTMVTLATFGPTPLLEFELFVTGAWVPGVTIDAPFALDTTYDRQTIYLSADGSRYDALYFVGASAADPAPLPEPASLAVFATGLAALAGVRRRRR